MLRAVGPQIRTTLSLGLALTGEAKVSCFLPLSGLLVLTKNLYFRLKCPCVTSHLLPLRNVTFRASGGPWCPVLTCVFYLYVRQLSIV